MDNEYITSKYDNQLILMYGSEFWKINRLDSKLIALLITY